MFYFNLLSTVLLLHFSYLTRQHQHSIQGNRGLKRSDFQRGVSYAHFQVLKFQQLQGSLLDSSCEVVQAKECALACVDNYNPPCVSFNIAVSPNENGKLRCELLSEDKFRSPSKLTVSQHFHHYSIKTPCSSSPCKNGATCIPNYEEDTYHCACAPGYTGYHCTTDVDECSSVPCMNGGICTDLVNGYKCTCQPGFMGVVCQAACLTPLGMENFKITHTQISASSQYDGYHTPNQGRLHYMGAGSFVPSWSAGANNLYQWLQIDLRIETTVTFVATQGRHAYNQWVTKYKLQYSNDGNSFQVYKNQGESSDKVFVGNSDAGTVVKHHLISSIKARYIRLIPTEWNNHISMRMELYGCFEEMQALGMESGAIKDSQMTASSEFDIYHSPKRARLHTKETSVHARGAWSSLTNDFNQWLQVDLGKVTSVTHVATQGRNSYSPAQMITKYKLQFSDDGATFLFYKRQGESTDAVFDGNFDRDTIVYHQLNPPITTRFLRIKPTAWITHISMRLELYTYRADI
ncbi:EGF-like repeat and discoidin I-like domain-containing protein 3 [Oculina patagonica]